MATRRPPREEKILNWRRQMHRCSTARCSICAPAKRYRLNKVERAQAKRAARREAGLE